MKRSFKTFVSHIFLLSLSLGISQAQVNTDLETTVVDVLAQLPTENLEHSDRLMREVMALGDTGILEFTSRLVPAGAGNDAEARYLVHSLAVYAGREVTPEERQLVESTFQKAIAEENDPEVKRFLLERLTFVATDRSVGFVSDYLGVPEYYQSALSVLESIGTQTAASAVYKELSGAEGGRQYAIIESLGELRYLPANESLIAISDTPDWVSVKYVLWSLSEIASEESYKTLVKAASTGKYRMDTKEGVNALMNYGFRLREKGNKGLSQDVGKTLMKNCKDQDQLHFRAAGLELQRDAEPSSLNKTLLKEVANSDPKYRGAVLDLAEETVLNQYYPSWIKYFNKASEETKIQILRKIGKINNSDVFNSCVAPSINGNNEELRIAAIKAVAYQEKTLGMPALLEKLEKKNSSDELLAIEETLLRMVDAGDAQSLAMHMNKVDEKGKITLVHVLGGRQMKIGFDAVANLYGTGSEELDLAVAQALGSVASTSNLDTLLQMLDQETSEKQVESLQSSVIEVLDASDRDMSSEVIGRFKNAERKSNWFAVLAALEDPEALNELEIFLEDGSEAEKQSAVAALSDWRNRGSIPLLYNAATSNQSEQLRSDAFRAYLKQVVASDHPDDQKLLLIKRILPSHKGADEKKMIIRSAGTLHTFLALVFVSEFIDEEGLVNTASNTAIRIALPTPTFEGLSGDVVRDIVSRSIDNLTGQDSQYLKIDVREFLENMPSGKGYLPLFNGKDLSGWQGLVEDPIKRSRMSQAQLERKQQTADQEMNQDWIVENGNLKFVGEGFKNICTVKKYGDFEMLVDWKIGEGGDSGVYLRGTPQVQIWDTALTEVGAQVGSGGLYNNKEYESKPMVVADNPVNHWNTFRIKIVGDVVTVHLNGILVVDQVRMENYWDRNQGLFPKEAIELQAHGENVEFRNVYVNEMGAE
jgi:HEAT repeat protein